MADKYSVRVTVLPDPSKPLLPPRAKVMATWGTLKHQIFISTAFSSIISGHFNGFHGHQITTTIQLLKLPHFFLAS
jgi:hypothetical protein